MLVLCLLWHQGGIRCSMSRRANGHDNALMESFYSWFKRELDLRSCATREQVEMEIFRLIEIDYDRKRLHSSLGTMTPEEYEMVRMKSKNTKTKPRIKKPPLRIKY
ncbi:MAG: integrase core domain-containing protein [Gemmataceae bacterium]